MEEQRLRYRGWRVTAASAVGLFVWSLPPYSFAVFLKPIAEDLELSRAAVSSLFGAAALSVAISAGPVGYLIDRVGGRAVILPFLALAGIAFALRALLEAPLWPFVIVFASSGISGVGSSPVGYARLLSTWFDRRRGLALGIAIAGGALGTIVHPVVAETLICELGWRSAHLVLGGLMLVIGPPVVALFVHPRPDPLFARGASKAFASCLVGIAKWRGRAGNLRSGGLAECSGTPNTLTKRPLVLVGGEVAIREPLPHGADLETGAGETHVSVWAQ